jgi:CheY-like chemotaxis protein
MRAVLLGLVAGGLVAACPCGARAAEPRGLRPAAPPVTTVVPLPDPLAKAVIDSLAFPPRTTPPELLDAALRAADVDAFDVADGYLAKLASAIDKAADREAVLADLGDAFDPGSLRRLERLLAGRNAEVRPLLRAIDEASRLRRRDPERLAQAARDLAAAAPAVRSTAVETLTRAGTDALPALVDILATQDADRANARRLAREIVAGLGADARQPLLAWLGSDDVEHWPGVIEALAATADAEGDAITPFLLAPALVADVPAAVRDRAGRLLAKLTHDERAAADDGPAISRDAAASWLADRLDRVLSIDGLPAADHLLMEPILDPTAAAAAGGKTVDRFVWDDASRRLVQKSLSPRMARAAEALHLARDLAALGADDPAAIRLVLLARLETLVAAAEHAPGAGESLPLEQVIAAVTGPEGFEPETVADVLELAASRGLPQAATAAARALDAFHAKGQSAAEEPAPMLPAERRALLRALELPDAAVQFEAARTLARFAGDPPYRGSSRVAEILMQAATSTGEDVAVVAHPEAYAREALATGLSRFGYRVEKVATGREAILATRANIDTALVVIAARTIRPSALETTQFIQQQPTGDIPPVLVVVDPLDDDPRGKFLTQLILKFSDLDCVGIMDRLDSLFLPQVDPATGAVLGPPRFPDQLARVAGPQAVAPAARAARAAVRRTRAAEALALLADLGRRGWDVSATETTARLALMQPPEPGSPRDLFAPAALLLGTIGTSSAQQALLREAERTDLPPLARQAAISSLAHSVDRFGVAIPCRPLQAAYARYNSATAAPDRAAAAAVLDALETPLSQARSDSTDAAHPRPTR